MSPSETTEPANGRARQLAATNLRPGWTTGACAAAAARAAWCALLGGDFPDPVPVDLPGGRITHMVLTRYRVGDGWAEAAITKDAGDDPDVTHGALIQVRVSRGAPGSGVSFVAGEGVGTVTREGLPLAVGEPAINPVPRSYIADNLARANGGHIPDAVIQVSIENGAELARKTWNPRLGILGGLSVLGTTGVVVPYSCSAWIDSIRRGIDVARAAGATHVAGCTGSTSERVVGELYPDIELIDMGDFVGAVLKYLRAHPIEQLTICGGIAKLSKLANGHLDLHSHRTSVDPAHLAALAESSGASPEAVCQLRSANTVAQAVQIFPPLGDLVANAAAQVARDVLDGAPVRVQVICLARDGAVVGRSG